MTQTIEVKIPDIGDFSEVAVIEVLVKPGDRIKIEDSIVTLESDKASMDVPSPAAGIVQSVMVKVGDKVAQGAVVLMLETSGAVEKTTAPKSAMAPTPTATPSQTLPLSGGGQGRGCCVSGLAG